MTDKIEKSDSDWQSQLSEDEYRITRCSGTEPAFTGKYHDFKGDGEYRCICCGSPLFDSQQKYDSGSGWPSYWQPTEGADIAEIRDISHGMIRTEVRCAKCDAHLGHVFPDGPQPTGLRYCINSASLEFKEREK